MKRLLLRMTSVFGVVGMLLSSTAWAQSTGTISGTVLDGSAASLPGATVTARNEGTGAVREVVTDESGRFTLPLLPIGRYAVTATMSGFQSQERTGVMLEVQASLTLEFTLGLAGLTDSVTVTGGATVVQLQRNDANLGQLINAAQVAE